MKHGFAMGLGLVVALVLCLTGTASASGGATGWGENSSGQLGNGSHYLSTSTPTVVSGLTEATAISAGNYHTLALLAGGTVEAWGDDSFGELGKAGPGPSYVPVAVSGLGEVVAIAAGGEGFSLALLANGTVKAWGNNEYGQLGDGTTTNRSEPVSVSGLSGVVAIAASGRSSAALLENGHVETWGANTRGQLGTGSTTGPEECTLSEFIHPACSKTPVEVTGLSEVTSIVAGGETVLALLTNHRVKAWGDNRFGQLGDGTSEGPEMCSPPFEPVRACSSAPVAVSEVTEATAVAEGAHHSLALIKGGTVDAWGDNESGQLGDGTTETRTTPVAVSGLTTATAISAGGDHSAAMPGFGIVETWGDNSHGALGVTGKGHSATPVSVPELNGVTAIAAGEGDTFAVGPVGPSVSSVSPASGATAGGTEVTITGTNFTGATKVEFGNHPAASFVVTSGTTIKAVAPAAKPGAVFVTVTTTHGTSDSGSAQEYTFLPSGVIEYGRCKKVGSPSGAYKGGGCTEPLKGGAWQWEAGFVKGGFTDSGVNPKIETTGKVKLLCKAFSGHGSYLGSASVSGVALVFTGCELGASKCSSTKAVEGEVVLSTLNGGLGWREKPANLVGLALSSSEEAGTVLEATCGGSLVRVRGSAVGAIAPINNMSAGFALKYKQSKGIQVPEGFEGEGTQTLEMSVGGGEYERAGLALEATQTNEEELEINTVV